ncbi:hypothetical protein LTR53_014711 [Teratosphaeriaceae sp. CCFEE 6253]|nr:hypothetical protein LTR53_014711 [Teratosphaeriaceae sp. CCFEE 6253]
MAATAPPPPIEATAIAAGDESDYGSDLDEATVDALLSPNPGDLEPPVILDDHGETRQPLLRLAKTRGHLPNTLTPPHHTPAKREASIEIEYDASNRRTFSPPPDEAALESRRRESEATAASPPPAPDPRPPLQRFRAHKPLSVTDFVSPAWCELQYWYSLTRYGRVKRTPAMKQGSSVHKVLEEQVHTEVRVDVVSKEDRFALRVWNVVQGLRTLMRTGMTREMEVWGVVGGEVVNGVIDQITRTCPDEEAERRMLEADAAGTGGAKDGQHKKEPALPADQRTLAQYFAGSGSSSLESNGSAWLGTLEGPPAASPQTLYIVDVKTRQSRSLPAHGSQTRPTQYQLMLYHRLFAALAANEVDAATVFRRYGLDKDAVFSDTFLAQMAGLGLGAEESPAAAIGEEWEIIGNEPGPVEQREEDPLEVLLAHNTLAKLWTHMLAAFALTVPQPTTSTSSPTALPPPLSPFLTAEFRSSASGTLLGRRHFAYSAPLLDAYVDEELRWWRGEREARGVELEEAFKCGYCEFAANCEWRKGKVEEGVQKMRLRREDAQARRRSEV